MSKSNIAQTSDTSLKSIDDEIEQTKLSLDSSIRDHSSRLAGLYARREVSLLAANLVSGIGGFVDSVLAAQKAPAPKPAPSETAAPVAAPPAKADAKADPKAGASKQAAPKAAPSKRSDSGKARPDKASAGAANLAVIAQAGKRPAAPKPAASSDAGPSTQLRALEVLKLAGAPMASGEIARAIGITGIGPHLRALTHRNLAVKMEDGRYAPAESAAA